jgi:hypothetical protein
MNLGRLIGVMLAVVAFAAGCAGTGGPSRSAAPAGAASVTVDPSQIFADVPQSP